MGYQEWDNNDQSIRSDERGMASEAYRDDNYRFKKCNFEREPKFIVDIGCNTGWFAKLASDGYPESIVLAYEIEESNYLRARERLKGHENIQVHHMAVIGENRAASLAKSTTSIGGHKALFENNDSYVSEKRFSADADTEQIRDLPEQISVKEIIEQNNIDFIDFLKMDCEGGEHELLPHIFKHDIDKKILNFALEFHGTSQPEWQKIQEELEKRFDEFVIPERETRPFRPGVSVSVYPNCKIIICKNHLNNKE
tara:strand:- start:9154 stop:9915 length:762 start_codon:yes stop_codon:yes gene_type:complete